MGLKLFGTVPLIGSFKVCMVFPLVIHSGTCVPCKHLFISTDSLSWTELNFLNQKPCILSWPSVFQFDIFNIILNKSMCISALGPFSFIVYPFSFFVMFFGYHVLIQNRSVFLTFSHLLSVVDRIFFRCFGMSCFVRIVLFFVDISLIFLLSPVISGLFPRVVLLFFFLSCLFLFVSPCSSIFPLFYHFDLFS